MERRMFMRRGRRGRWNLAWLPPLAWMAVGALGMLLVIGLFG